MELEDLIELAEERELDPDEIMGRTKTGTRAIKKLAAALEENDEEGEGDEDDDVSDEGEVDLDAMDRTELRTFIRENELGIRVVKSMSDDDVREAIAEALEEEPEPEPEEATDEYDDWTLRKLKAELRKRGHADTGSKDDLIADLRELDAKEGSEDSDENEYDEWEISELKEEAKDRGLKTTGSKAVLIARILEDDAEED